MNNRHKKFSIFLFLFFTVFLLGQEDVFARSYSVEVETGLGYDSNVFRSSDTSYLDPFAPKTPGGTIGTTNPKVQSGLFVPYQLKAEYRKSLRKFPWLRKMKLRRWTSEFKLNGRKYFDSELDNADSNRIALKTGLEFLLKKEGRETKEYLIYRTPRCAENKDLF